MTIICKEPYPNSCELKYGDHFKTFPYPLSDFQKYAIQGIVDGNHTLVTAHTGSGKTLPIEFAIRHFIPKGKRIVYLGPLKSLVDQKYYDFSKKFPDVTFGIMTSDIKYNPTAQVLIMTTEIFMNYLFSSNAKSGAKMNKDLSFEIDIDNELACVVFDEVHFILDEQRGHVWEKTILMLPYHVQLIMLSATLQDPLKLCKFVESRYHDCDKEIVLSTTESRIVPLNHYAYMTTIESIFKRVKDKETQKQIRDTSNKLILLKSENGIFQEKGYNDVKHVKHILNSNQVYIKRSHVLNTLAKHLCENEMLPAIFFTFSRKNVEQCASEITTNILEFDSKIPYTVRHEAEQIVRKLPNYQEYLKLPEYEFLMCLLEKGIAIHHSGMIPILREIVELFIDRKYIKILFATDSFSVGLNCAIKTTVFTAMKKFDGIGEQYLQPHLYSQCAGRAGRRGIDTVGNVIHCNNLFDLPSPVDYKEILCGKPQKMESKFRISYDIILNLIKNGTFSNFESFVERSMIKTELGDSENGIKLKLAELTSKLEAKDDFIKTKMKTPIPILQEYLHAKANIAGAQNKKRKEIERTIQRIEDQYKGNVFSRELENYESFMALKNEVSETKKDLEYLGTFIQKQVEAVVKILLERQFVEPTETGYNFSKKGSIASNIAEVHSLVLVDWMQKMNNFEAFTEKELVGLFSCFTDIRAKEDMRVSRPINIGLSEKMEESLGVLEGLFLEYEELEDLNNMYTGISYKTPLVFDVIDEMMQWAEAEDEMICKEILQMPYLATRGITSGDFLKGIMKICNVAKEIMSVCEEQGLVELMHKLNKVNDMMMKYICTNQSLYI
jgi:superfamily II RNA helicase